MLHNHWRHRLWWLCNIPKVSINSLEPRIWAITDLDYCWLVFPWNKTYMSIDIPQYICCCKQWRSWISTDYWFKTWLASILSNKKLCYNLDIFKLQPTHGLTRAGASWFAVVRSNIGLDYNLLMCYGITCLLILWSLEIHTL